MPKITSLAITWGTDTLARFDTSVSAPTYQPGVSRRLRWKPVKAEAERRTSTSAWSAGLDAWGADEYVWVPTSFPSSGMVTGIIGHTRDANAGRAGPAA